MDARRDGETIVQVKTVHHTLVHKINCMHCCVVITYINYSISIQVLCTV